jgi:hypothetical protein
VNETTGVVNRTNREWHCRIDADEVRVQNQAPASAIEMGRAWLSRAMRHNDPMESCIRSRRQ